MIADRPQGSARIFRLMLVCVAAILLAGCTIPQNFADLAGALAAPSVSSVTQSPQPALLKSTPDAADVQVKDVGSTKILVCHDPNNEQGGTTMELPRSALAGHLAHGDTLGGCH